MTITPYLYAATLVYLFVGFLIVIRYGLPLISHISKLENGKRKDSVQELLVVCTLIVGWPVLVWEQ